MIRTPHRLAAAFAACTVSTIVLIADPAAGVAGSTITPTAGTPGTTITVVGASPGDIDRSFWATHDAEVYLERNVNGGTFQLVARGRASITTAGLLKVSVRVPGQGDYIGGKPDGRFHPASIGTYGVTFPCHACATGLTFTVTGQLAETGQPDGTLAALGGLLVLAGAGLTYTGRRRPTLQ